VLYAFGGFFLAAYFAVVIVLAVNEEKLIFFPPQQFPRTQPVEVDDLHIPVNGTSYVHAWWISAKAPDAPTILYFHGNAGVLEREANVEVPLLRETGANLLLVDYRGYGTSSPVQPDGRTTREDALASFHYLEHERHVPAKRIVIFGWSIGSGVATQLAVDAPDAGGLILLSPITSVPDVANNETWMFRYALRPAQWLRHENDFANKEKIGTVHMPVLIVVGCEDTLAPPWMAKALYARANEPKYLRILEGTGHNDAMQPGEGALLRDLQDFLMSLRR